MEQHTQPRPSGPGHNPGHPVRLGKNVRGYLGETVDIRAVLREIQAVARSHGWTTETFLEAAAFDLIALTRSCATPRKRVYLSAGIHGDEPAGPLAIRQMLENDEWPEDLEFFICPCLNPLGFMLNRRENSEGTDLNRQYLAPKAPEIVAHVNWLLRQPPFDLCLCLHEDWEAHGFYLYEINPQNQPSLAEAIVARAATVCPIDHSELIEGRPSRNGVIRPQVDPLSRPDWPEAFFLQKHKTHLSYTLEAPSDFPLPNRVAALQEAVKGALQATASPVPENPR